MLLRVNRNYTMRAYISTSPPPLVASGRTHDLDAILNCIDTALEFVNIAVMDYFPLIVNGAKVQYWPPIDNALRRAAVERGVAVKLLISWWKHSDPNEDNYLRSLQELSTSNHHHVDVQIVSGFRNIRFICLSIFFFFFVRSAVLLCLRMSNSWKFPLDGSIIMPTWWPNVLPTLALPTGLVNTSPTQLASVWCWLTSTSRTVRRTHACRCFQCVCKGLA